MKKKRTTRGRRAGTARRFIKANSSAIEKFRAADKGAHPDGVVSTLRALWGLARLRKNMAPPRGFIWQFLESPLCGKELEGLPLRHALYTLLDAVERRDADFFLAMGRHLKNRHPNESADPEIASLALALLPGKDPVPGVPAAQKIIRAGAKRSVDERTVRRAMQKVGYPKAKRGAPQQTGTS